MVKKRSADPRRRAKKDYEAAFKAVQAVLLKHWDPLGVKEGAAALEAYSPYVAQVVFLAKTGASRADITGHLAHIEGGRMGLSRTAPKRRSGRKQSGEAVLEYFRKLSPKV